MRAGFVSALLLRKEDNMENIKFYEINATYIDYLKPYAPHLFHNRREGQVNERKYIGVVLQVRGNDYFAPLSSFKPKHQRMKEGLDFIKVRHYAVINLNNMFPVPSRPALVRMWIFPLSKTQGIALFCWQNIVL